MLVLQPTGTDQRARTLQSTWAYRPLTAVMLEKDVLEAVNIYLTGRFAHLRTSVLSGVTVLRDWQCHEGDATAISAATALMSEARRVQLALRITIQVRPSESC